MLIELRRPNPRDGQMIGKLTEKGRERREGEEQQKLQLRQCGKNRVEFIDWDTEKNPH